MFDIEDHFKQDLSGGYNTVYTLDYDPTKVAVNVKHDTYKIEWLAHLGLVKDKIGDWLLVQKLKETDGVGSGYSEIQYRVEAEWTKQRIGYYNPIVTPTRVESISGLVYCIAQDLVSFYDKMGIDWFIKNALTFDLHEDQIMRAEDGRFFIIDPFQHFNDCTNFDEEDYVYKVLDEVFFYKQEGKASWWKTHKLHPNKLYKYHKKQPDYCPGEDY